MTTSQIIACAIAWTAALVAVAALIRVRRASRPPVRPPDGEVCGRYQPPTSPEDSGLCARCGMSDYKHEGKPGA